MYGEVLVSPTCNPYVLSFFVLVANFIAVRPDINKMKHHLSLFAAEPAWSKVSDSRAGSALVTKANTPPLRPSPKVKCYYMPTAGMHGFLRIH